MKESEKTKFHPLLSFFIQTNHFWKKFCTSFIYFFFYLIFQIQLEKYIDFFIEL